MQNWKIKELGTVKRGPRERGNNWITERWKGPKAHFSCFRALHLPSESEPGLRSTRGKGRGVMAPVQALATKASFRPETVFSSAQFSHSVMSNSLQPHGLQGLPVDHQLPEFTQTHVHWVSDAIQPSHPLSSPSPPTFNLSQHQGLFQWVNSSHQVAKVLEFQLQHQSFQWTPRTDLL